MSAPQGNSPNLCERTSDLLLGKCGDIVLGDTICYIGIGIVLRENIDSTEVLLTQEAKRNCYGKWYIPAGHIEKDENIVDGVVREVREETGIECRAESLVAMEVKGSGWYRFTFFCEFVGGELKTLADRESLRADWFSVDQVIEKKIPLRSHDFFPILRDAIKYRKWRRDSSLPFSIPRFLPVRQSIEGLFVEFLFYRKTSSGIELLVNNRITDVNMLELDLKPFPVVEFGLDYPLPMVISKCYQYFMVDGRSEIEIPTSFTLIRCSPKSSDGDGIWMRIICAQKRSFHRPRLDDNSHHYHWLDINSDATARLGLDECAFRPSLHLL